MKAEHLNNDWARCCELAGLLAEAGVLHVTLISGDARTELHARTTDLPRTLFEADLGARLLWPNGEAVREPDGWKQRPTG